MKRHALILILSAAAISLASAAPPDPAVADLFKQAQAASTAKNFDEAIKLYEQVITEHPTASARWFEAQLSIAQNLAKKGAWDDAAKAIHICLDSAQTPQAFDGAVATAAGIFSAQDKNVDHANQFLSFAQTGAGKNPMEAIGYPTMPERETALAAIRQQAGDDDAAAKLRATTYLLTGKPKEALAVFADAFRRSTNNTQTVRASSDLVLIGLRAMRGNRAGLETAAQFIIYGPNGPDGKPGSSDDLPDPFASYLPEPPLIGEGGLAQYTPDDLAELKKVREAAQLYWADPLLAADIRKTALGSLLKATSALDGWGAPGQKEQFLQAALESTVDDQTRALLLSCAEAAAKGRQLNFGSVQALWAEIDAKKIPATKGTDDARKQFNGLCEALNKIPFPKITTKPLTVPAKY